MTYPRPTGHLPHATGVYLFRDASGDVLYVGKALDLARRVPQHFDPKRGDRKTEGLLPLVRTIDYLLCSSEREALVLEDRLIKRFMPFFNVLGKDNKTYPWIKLTVNEDFPRLLWTRRKKRDGAAYFGPFPKVSLVRGLLRYLWRARIFPLRPCHWEFSVAKPLDQKIISACLYYHTRECPAPCAGRISRKDYRKIADGARLFLSGQFSRLQKDFEAGMARESWAMRYERAGEFRDRLSALRHLKERVSLREVTEGGLARRLEGSRAVTALQQALGLAKPPAHIEAVDISHSQGKLTVGSFVCFKGGEPNKDHYRRLRVKTVAGIDDFASMREVVGRRMKGLTAAGSPLPDLLLVDGGKGQLGAALEALGGLKLQLPTAGLAKREEEVFLPGRSQPLLLGRDDEALKLLQRLRDEAHRFAVTYHRLLRKKELLKEDA